nr:hypothetical protein [Amycolatopsis jejuensis]
MLESWLRSSSISAGPARQARIVLLAADGVAVKVPGPTSTERQRIRDLGREVRDLKEANGIPKAASIFFARELDPHHH